MTSIFSNFSILKGSYLKAGRYELGEGTDESSIILWNEKGPVPFDVISVDNSYQKIRVYMDHNERYYEGTLYKLSEKSVVIKVDGKKIILKDYHKIEYMDSDNVIIVPIPTDYMYLSYSVRWNPSYKLFLEKQTGKVGTLLLFGHIYSDVELQEIKNVRLIYNHSTHIQPKQMKIDDMISQSTGGIANDEIIDYTIQEPLVFKGNMKTIPLQSSFVIIDKVYIHEFGQRGTFFGYRYETENVMPSANVLIYEDNKLVSKSYLDPKIGSNILKVSTSSKVQVEEEITKKDEKENKIEIISIDTTIHNTSGDEIHLISKYYTNYKKIISPMQDNMKIHNNYVEYHFKIFNKLTKLKIQLKLR